MRVTLFSNGKGVIHGKEPRRIVGDRDGVLKIGKQEINVSADKEEILPILFYGATGEYNATFTDTKGVVFTLEKVTLSEGRIVSPPAESVELIELRVRVDKDEKDIEYLKKIFDTNSLNFLIK